MSFFSNLLYIVNNIITNVSYYLIKLIDAITISVVGFSYDWPNMEIKEFKQISIVSLSEKYISDMKTRFLLSYDLYGDKNDYNSNIDPIFYSKEEYQKMIENEDNVLENQWKTRIMIENTPRGNIFMFYNVYKQGFSYYCDQTNVPYNLLNAVAMKYSLKYRCRDFFLDEYIIPESCPSKLILLEKLENKPKQNTDAESKDDEDIWMNKMKSGPFVKLKSYNQNQTKAVSKNKENSNLKMTNRFIYLGQVRNMTLLQKPPKEVKKSILPANKKMSYQEYKRLTQNNK